MRVLVTGYGGFLGAAICRQLIDQGFSVRGLARSRYPELEKLGVEDRTQAVITAMNRGLLKGKVG